MFRSCSFGFVPEAVVASDFEKVKKSVEMSMLEMRRLISDDDGDGSGSGDSDSDSSEVSSAGEGVHSDQSSEPATTRGDEVVFVSISSTSNSLKLTRAAPLQCDPKMASDSNEVKTKFFKAVLKQTVHLSQLETGNKAKAFTTLQYAFL